MLTLMKPRSISTMLWPRRGTTVILRVPSQKSTRITMVTRMRIAMIRLISNGVPTNRKPGGKNSSNDGPWNPPSSVADGTSRFTAVTSSAISCFGAWSSALATTNDGGDSERLRCHAGERSERSGTVLYSSNTSAIPRTGRGRWRRRSAPQFGFSDVGDATPHEDDDVDDQRPEHSGDEAEGEGDRLQPRLVAQRVRPARGRRRTSAAIRPSRCRSRGR